MAKKGLTFTLILIVTIVVLLIVALVLLTVFGLGIQSVASLTEAKSMCIILNSPICVGDGPDCPNVMFSVYRQDTGEVDTCGAGGIGCTCTLGSGGCQLSC